MTTSLQKGADCWLQFTVGHSAEHCIVKEMRERASQADRDVVVTDGANSGEQLSQKILLSQQRLSAHFSIAHCIHSNTCIFLPGETNRK